MSEPAITIRYYCSTHTKNELRVTTAPEHAQGMKSFSLQVRRCQQCIDGARVDAATTALEAIVEASIQAARDNREEKKDA